MRLFVERIRSNVKKLKLVSKTLENTDNNLIAISGYLPMIDAIKSLEEFSFLQPEIKSLKEITQIFNRKPSTIIIGRDTLALVENHLKLVHLKCEAVFNAIDQVMSEQKTNSINVKQPSLYENYG